MSIEVADEVAFEALLGHIREVRGFDFSGYKRASLSRRIAKRMSEVKVADHVAYLRLLENVPDEFAKLFDTVLINVTAFFRDPEAWTFLADEVLPALADRDEQEPVRVWCAGSASGEEAYTLAMLLCEQLGEQRYRRSVKIYGSDADEDAIATARRARYPADAVRAAVSEERIERFFRPDDDHFVFRSDLRRSVIFGRHDLLQDPPISRVDLVTCRNTLMYFNADAQRRILAGFHFALNKDAHLMLGKSEALASRSDLFTVVDLKQHVFARAGASPLRRFTSAAVNALGSRDDGIDELLRAGFESSINAQVMVDRRLQLAAANRHARHLFTIVGSDIGQPFKDVEVSYRPVELRSRIDQVLDERRPMTVADVAWTAPGGTTELFEARLEPMGPDLAPLGVVITFVETGRYKLLREEMEHLQRQLGNAYEELQSTVEELETTNEELQSTNEELETTNEELHSSNEELETMNEELQSTNEELESINGELHQRSADLDEVNGFLGSILTSLGPAIIVLNRAMGVRVWNRQAVDMWGLRADEVQGRHFMDLDIGLPVGELSKTIDVLAVDDEMPPVEMSIRAVNRRGRTIECHLDLAQLRRPSGENDGVIIAIQATPVPASAAEQGPSGTPASRSDW